MDVGTLTEQVADLMIGMTDDDDNEFGVYSLDVGEVFLKAPDGSYWLLMVTKTTAENVAFIEPEDWS